MVVLVALLFGAIAMLGLTYASSLCDKIIPFEDGPEPGKPPTAVLVGGAVCIGALLASRQIAILELGIVAVLVTALAACWYSDVRCGILPDIFTLGPLGFVLAISLLGHNFSPAAAAAIVVTPFAIVALFSKGRGMGWGDVKLVALGAAALGLNRSIIAFAGAGFAAFAIASFRRRRGIPIAFAPYLAASIACSLIIPEMP